ncbi:hypothetical protein CEXT_355531 [Caerostris extrusa]|uniref:Transmembrane protein n=1 Tax=Caerostris extrusa TaxID=172846 RepID=A0AAV4REX9_CAEEX|nr:hypothetical protein CEXT_355531 [Caerostris extrusa]
MNSNRSGFCYCGIDAPITYSDIEENTQRSRPEGKSPFFQLFRFFVFFFLFFFSRIASMIWTFFERVTVLRLYFMGKTFSDGKGSPQTTKANFFSGRNGRWKPGGKRDKKMIEKS